MKITERLNDLICFANYFDRIGQAELAIRADREFEIVRLAAYSYQTELEKLNSKATSKRLFWLYQQMRDKELADIEDRKQRGVEAYEPSAQVTDKDIPALQKQMIEVISRAVPADVGDAEKGLAVVWLKNRYLDPEDESGFHTEKMKHDLEKFFQLSELVPADKRDLLTITTPEELSGIVSTAKNKNLLKMQNTPGTAEFAAAQETGSEQIYQDDD